jgi:hypothetical protein
LIAIYKTKRPWRPNEVDEIKIECFVSKAFDQNVIES